jgi:hypothetical protein
VLFIEWDSTQAERPGKKRKAQVSLSLLAELARPAGFEPTTPSAQTQLSIQRKSTSVVAVESFVVMHCA